MSKSSVWHVYITDDLNERPTADDIRQRGTLSTEVAPAAYFAEQVASRNTIGAGPWHVWWARPGGHLRCHLVHSTRAFFGMEVKP